MVKFGDKRNSINYKYGFFYFKDVKFRETWVMIVCYVPNSKQIRNALCFQCLWLNANTDLIMKINSTHLSVIRKYCRTPQGI